MACDEHQAQQIVADVVVERGVDIDARDLLVELELAAELFVLAFEERPAA